MMLEESAKKLLEDCLKLKDTYPIQSKDEETEMIEKFKNDRTTLNQKLFLHNIRIAFNLVKKYSRTAPSYEELLHNALTGLMVATTKFEPDRGTKFSTCAYIWVFKYISQEWYKQTKVIADHSISLDAVSKSLNTTGSENNEDKSFANIVNKAASPDSYCSLIPARYDQAKNVELKNLSESLDSFIKTKKFSKFDQKFYDKVFKNQMSISNVSVDMGITEKEAVAKKFELRAELKEYLAKRHGVNCMTDLC